MIKTASQKYLFTNHFYKIQGFIELMDNRGRVTERLQLRNLFNNPQTLYRSGAFDEYLNGYTAEPTQTFDKFFTQEVKHNLFRHGFNFDLCECTSSQITCFKNMALDLVWI